MSSYYYLLAALPLLSLREQPYISLDQFRQFAKDQMPISDYRELLKASIVPEQATGNRTFIKKWVSWESALRYSLAEARQKDVDFNFKLPEQRDYEPMLWQTIQQTLQAENPYQAEYILDMARWAYIEELESGKYFSLSNVFAYYLKLQILERRFTMTEELGNKRYQEAYDALKNEFTAHAFGDQ